MRVLRFGIAFLAAFSFASQPAKNRTVFDRLTDTHLDAVHQARVQWMRDRVVYPPLGIYHDYRTIIDPKLPSAERDVLLKAAKEDAVNAILYTHAEGSTGDAWSGIHDGVLFVPGDIRDDKLCFPANNCVVSFAAESASEASDRSKDVNAIDLYSRGAADPAKAPDYKRLKKRIAGKWKEYPDEVFGAVMDTAPVNLSRWESKFDERPLTGVAFHVPAESALFGDAAELYALDFRLIATHVLALDLTQNDILDSLMAGHAYVAHDWLCDPSGFSFIAMNHLGVFEIGDPVPFVPNTRLVARFPVPATARLIHNGQVIAEKDGPLFDFTPTELGAYRLEARLKVDGEERPWIFSNPVYLRPPDASAYALPPATLAPGVEAFGDIPYVSGDDGSDEHRLDLYLPQGKKNFPVLVFLHGGSGPMGDRRVYTYIGNRFATAGIGVVIPSYRLAPANDPPAQVEDAAAAFAWVQKNIAGYGGDPKRIIVAGHSTGGGLAALLALDPKYLAVYGLKPGDIRGVVGISGIYRASKSANADAAKAESAIDFVNNSAPRFLVAYSQWDYLGLPQQARELDAALRRNFASSKLVFLPRENHISEIIHLPKDDDPLARAIIGFVRSAALQ